MPSETKTTKKTSRSRKKKLTAEERYLKIQEIAYCLAEKDGFKNDAVDYWLAAEAEIGA